MVSRIVSKLCVERRGKEIKFNIFLGVPQQLPPSQSPKTCNIRGLIMVDVGEHTLGECKWQNLGIRGEHVVPFSGCHGYNLYTGRNRKGRKE